MNDETKGVLFIKASLEITMESIARIKEQIEPIAEELNLKPIFVDYGIDVSIQNDLKPLVDEMRETNQALKSYTVASFELLNVVAQLLEIVASGQEEDPDAEPQTYLDGSPK